jgi:SET domain-containing protein
LNDNEYHKVIANNNIQKGEILLIEYPQINLFGENEIDKGLQLTKKYIEDKESNLYPRNINNFPRTNMIKNVHKIIKNTDKKLKDFFSSYSKDEIEMYYAKYIFNAFEGWKYGPLTLPLTAKFNHSCDPNIEFKFNDHNGTMVIKSIKNIKKGSEVFDSYLVNKDLKDHDKYLYEHYGFVCNDCLLKKLKI